MSKLFAPLAMTAVMTLSTALTTDAFAQTSPGTMSAPTATGVDASAAELADGEIRKVDKEGKKITIKHGPLKNLDMPGMTMVFAVKDEAVLDQVQTGDKVRFKAEKLDGKITVTRIEAAP